MTMAKDDHYDAVLADLEAQVATLQTAIAAIKAVRSGGAIAPIGTANIFEGTGPINAAAEIAIDAFHKLTIAQSIKKYLAMRPKKPATTQEIVDALTAGGQSGSDGPNFANVVNNSLNRMAAADGDVSKVKRGVWGLKAWYETKSAE
jgi:hypothetical protein